MSLAGHMVGGGAVSISGHYRRPRKEKRRWGTTKRKGAGGRNWIFTPYTYGLRRRYTTSIRPPPISVIMRSVFACAGSASVRTGVVPRAVDRIYDTHNLVSGKS